MDEQYRLKTSAVVDIFVAIGILIVGILIIMAGMGFLDFLYQVSASSYSTDQFDWLRYVAWGIAISGLVTIIYGFKRFAIDLLTATSQDD